MSELLLAVYEREDTAAHVLGVLRAQPSCPDASPSLASAAVISIEPDGTYTVITTDRPGSATSFWGVFWESLFGLVFLVPTPGSAHSAGPSLGGLFGTLERAGLDVRFRNQVSRSLRPGCSALALLASHWAIDTIIRRLSLAPVELVRTTLSPEQDLELMTELGGAPLGD
jgi:uncharacterized membrane protein